jgi:hypothetical protein
MKKKGIMMAIIILIIGSLSHSQDINNYLIVEDIGNYKKITKGGPSGNILAAAGHFGLDHKDVSYGIAYVNDETQIWVEVQVTQHAGGDSDKWLLHEVERGFRRGDYEENMTPARFRNIDGNNIFYSGLGGGTYRWINNHIVVSIEYIDLYKQKPEPIEVVKAYLVKFPSTVPAILIDRTHNEQWVKNEMERRLWLCDKWFLQLQMGKVDSDSTLREVVDHMIKFLDYREKYYGINASNEKGVLDNYLINKDGTAIKNKLTEYKTWWSVNKTKSISLP